MTVSGSPCFTTGTAAAEPVNGIAGDEIYRMYVMDDGSTLALHGEFADPAESAIEIATFVVDGGSCQGMAGDGTLVLAQ